MKYHFKIHKEKKGFWAECLELEGCVTQADSKDELLENMQEALNLYLDEPEDSKNIFPLPLDKEERKKNIFQVSVDSKVAFALLLRRARQEQNLTQNAMAQLLNHSSIFSYQKLESSRTANPTLSKVHKLKQLLPNLRLDLLFA